MQNSQALSNDSPVLSHVDKDNKNLLLQELKSHLKQHKHDRNTKATEWQGWRRPPPLPRVSYELELERSGRSPPVLDYTGFRALLAFCL